MKKLFFTTVAFTLGILGTAFAMEKTETESPRTNTIFVNVKKVLIGILVFAGVTILFFILRAFIMNGQNARRRRNKIKRKQIRRERTRSSFDDFDF